MEVLPLLSGAAESQVDVDREQGEVADADPEEEGGSCHIAAERDHQYIFGVDWGNPNVVKWRYNSPATFRSSNFWILPVEVLGSS